MANWCVVQTCFLKENLSLLFPCSYCGIYANTTTVSLITKMHSLTQSMLFLPLPVLSIYCLIKHLMDSILLYLLPNLTSPFPQILSGYISSKPTGLKYLNKLLIVSSSSGISRDSFSLRYLYLPLEMTFWSRHAPSPKLPMASQIKDTMPWAECLRFYVSPCCPLLNLIFPTSFFLVVATHFSRQLNYFLISEASPKHSRKTMCHLFHLY